MLAGLAFCEMLSQYPQSAFHGVLRGVARGAAAVCDPNTPCPFARSRMSGAFKQAPRASRNVVLATNIARLEVCRGFWGPLRSPCISSSRLAYAWRCKNLFKPQVLDFV